MQAKDLIDENETAVVFFTRGERFHIGEGGRGSTGNWKMAPGRAFDKVIVYRRDPATQTNEVYVAIPVGVRPNGEADRYIIDLADIRYVGTTEANWTTFAEAGPNPVRYLTSN